MIRLTVGRKLAVTILLTAVVLAGGLVYGKPASAATLPAPTLFAAGKADNCNKGFFGLEPWYHFLPDYDIGVGKIGDASVDNCGIACFNIFPQSAPNQCAQAAGSSDTASDIPGVILSIIDDLLRIAAIVAVAFIIIGSFQFIGSRGNSERASNAQSAIMNALTGLAVAMVALALVSFLGAQLH